MTESPDVCLDAARISLLFGGASELVINFVCLFIFSVTFFGILV